MLSLASLAGPEIAAAQTQGGSAIHVVSWGETLFSIASRYGVSQQAIIAANGLVEPDRLYAGQQLIIPGAAAAAPQAPAVAGTHIVQPGQGLYRIGLIYGVSTADLMAANGLSNPDQIYVGQVLVIPAPGSAPAVAPAAPAPVATGGVHVVQVGETLFRIGQRYGVTVADLVAANGLLNAAQIYAGQQLTIPSPGTVTGAPTTAPAAASPALTGTHIVQAGETLGDIAARFGTSIAELAQANSLSNPSLIYTGQALIVPGAGTGRSAVQPAAAASGGVHTVQQGETLFRIALRYGISVADLMAANGLGSNTIYSGQTLTIPAGGVVSAAPAPISASNAPSPTITNGKQIVVDLSQQMVYAYENGQLLRQFVVSTGLPQYPTVTGDYAIYVKYTSTRMTGPDYDLPNVPWTMYFYKGYGFHGTYWHNNFGQPMSHGCINMRTPEAEWLFNWAPVGTAVHIVW